VTGCRHVNSALIAGGSVAAARAIAHGQVDRAVNFCGGLQRALVDGHGQHPGVVVERGLHAVPV